VAVSSAEQPKLATGALGLGAQLFQSITHMAPVAGIVFSVQYMASQGGASLTLAYILATIACTLTALCLKELVRKVRSPGGYFVIHSVALGHFAGFTTSWMYFIYDPLIPASAALLWGAMTQDFLATYVGISIPWWVFTIIMASVLTFVSYVGVRQSARVTMVLGTIETVVFGLLGLILILKAGSHQPVTSLSPVSSPNAFGGVLFAMIYGILSFIGFEAGVPLSEESYNAKRSLMIAIMASCVGIGLFYCFMAYGTVAGWGNFDDPSAFAGDFGDASKPVFYILATRAFGAIGPLIMWLLITNSLYAVGVAGTNAVTRVYFSLGRAGVFPKALGLVNPTTRTPANAILLQGVISLGMAFVAGFAFGVEPLVAYGLIGLLMTIGAVIVYMMTNLSCVALYTGPYKREFNVFNHLVIPILATIVFIPPLVASLYPRALDLIQPGLGFDNTYPVSLALPICIIWAIIGLAIYFYLRATRPQALDVMANEMARVELVGEEEDPTSRAVLVR